MERPNQINHRPADGCASCAALWEELIIWKEREAMAQGKIVELQSILGELRGKNYGEHE